MCYHLGLVGFVVINKRRDPTTRKLEMYAKMFLF